MLRIDEGLRAALQALEREHLAQPCQSDEDRRVSDYVAALLVDGYLGRIIDPEQVPPGDLARTAQQLGDAWWELPLGERLWLTTATGERAGLLEVAGQAPYLYVHRLYVRPSLRGQGVGGRVLRLVAETVERHHLAGVAVGTQWTWPRAWRAYRAMGLWLRMYKRDLNFTLMPRLGRPCVHATAYQLSVWARPIDQPCPGHHGEPVLARAVRDEHSLTQLDASSDTNSAVSFLAGSTLCLELAARGWPMWRQQPPEQVGGGDAGLEPETLALRIERWVAYAREQGWMVPADLPTLQTDPGSEGPRSVPAPA